MNQQYIVENVAGALNEALAQVHDKVLEKLVLEHLIKYGKVTIEEAQFYNVFAKQIITEASHLFVPNAEEITESLQALTEAEFKVLVDPETGEKYVYDPETGTLTPAADDVEVDDKDEDGVPDAEEDHGELPDDFEGDHEDAEEEALENKEDITDSSCKTESEEVTDKTKETVEETVEESETKTEEKKELTENELLVEKLFNSIKSTF